MRCPKCGGELREARVFGALGRALRGVRQLVCSRCERTQGLPYTLASKRRQERERERSRAPRGPRVSHREGWGSGGRGEGRDYAVPVGDRE